MAVRHGPSWQCCDKEYTLNARTSSRIDLRFFFGESLFESEHLSRLQQVLSELAPQWSRGLHIYRRGVITPIIDVLLPGSLENAVKSAAAERGLTYTALVKASGTGPFARRSGVVELRGCNRSLITIVRTDEWVFSPASGEWHFANSITLQILQERAEKQDAVLWARTAFAVLCERLSPVWAVGHCVDEYASKNMSTEGGGLKAVGVDISRYLPGLYWLNFFGASYCELIGMDRLLSCPAEETKKVDNGVLVRVSDRPTDWRSERYRQAEAEILGHVGDVYFFDRRKPNNNTIAPRFAFPQIKGIQKG